MLTFFRPSAPRHAPAVRAFDPADAPRLVDIWTRAYAGYAGLVVQTTESWRWRVTARPGITPADIPVATDASGTPIGYGVVDATGSVLEVAVDPALAVGLRDAAAVQIVEALEARCRARGGETIRFVLPDADDAVRRALQAGGYWSEPTPSFTGTIVDVAALLEAVLPRRLQAVAPGWSPTFRLEVERGPDWPYPRLATRVAVGPPLVVESEAPGTTTPAVDCTIRLSLATLNRLFVKLDSFETALTAGAVLVQPGDRVPDAARLLGMVTLGDSWYSPLADGR